MKIFVKHTWLFTRRSLLNTIRNPFAFIPNMVISLFFLLVYQAGLSGISELPAFGGASYLAFILPVSIVSGAIGGAGGAGQSLITDLENGYFSRLLLTPASRLAIVLGTHYCRDASTSCSNDSHHAHWIYNGSKSGNRLWRSCRCTSPRSGVGTGFCGLFRWVCSSNEKCSGCTGRNVYLLPTFIPEHDLCPL